MRRWVAINSKLHAGAFVGASLQDAYRFRSANEHENRRHYISPRTGIRIAEQRRALEDKQNEQMKNGVLQMNHTEINRIIAVRPCSSTGNFIQSFFRKSLSLFLVPKPDPSHKFINTRRAPFGVRTKLNQAPVRLVPLTLAL